LGEALIKVDKIDDVIYFVWMGRRPTYSHRLNCRIDREAAEILYEVLNRVGGGKRKPIGRLISLLILKTEPETWQKIIKRLPPKPFWQMTSREQARVSAERKIAEQLKEQESRERKNT
jgi:hypothetical protein